MNIRLLLLFLLGPTLAVFVIAQPSKPPPSDAESRTPERWRGSDVSHPFISVHIRLPNSHEHSPVLMRMGDDPRWALPDWEPREWTDVTDRGIPTREGIFWLRFKIRGQGPLPAGISQKVAAAYELYWDGKLIGVSGVPGETEEDEQPGKLDTGFSIPGEWLEPDVKHRKGTAARAHASGRPGEHVIALRMSTFRCGFPGEWTDLQLAFVDPEKRLATFSQIAMQPTLAAGAMLMLAFISLLMWLVAARRPALLLFHGLCVCAAVTQGLTMLRYVNSYTYDWHYPVRLATVYLSGALGACLIDFVCVHFGVTWRRWLLLGFAVVFAVIVWMPADIFYQPLSQKSAAIVIVSFGLALVAAIQAATHRRSGAWIVIVGALLSMATGGNIADGGFLPTFLPILLGLLVAVAVRLREERAEAEEARLAASRLETELLKKNLQPHFVLNTLTALSEVVERDPPGAVKLIEDLAEEFRAISRMSGEKQVPLAQELELCRAHLRVMSTRTGKECRLEASVPDETAPVPPALFLTLIENGFVHQRPRHGEMVFALRSTPVDGGVRYTFFSPGEIKRRPGRADGGTGMRYVRARLDESFAGQWSLQHGPERDGWQTIIELRGRGQESTK